MKALSLWRGVIEIPDDIPVHLPSMLEICFEVAAANGCSPAEIRGRDRKPRVSKPRQEFMGRAWETGRFTLNQIGRFLDGRDHTTIIHGIKRFHQRAALALA